MTNQKIIDRDGTPLHYWLHGPDDAPVIVLMHGAGMDHRMFDEQVDSLSDAYRVLVWDARGHGLSQPVEQPFTMRDCADDLVAILDKEGIDQAVVGGQSMGGYIAQYVYLSHPERVRAMIIIGSTGIALPYSRSDMMGLRVSTPIIRWWPYDSFAKVSAKATALTPEVQAYALEAFRQIPAKTFHLIWEAVEGAISRDGLPDHTIDVPLLFLHGDHDRTGTIKRDAARWVAHEPDITYQVVPQAGHNANQDNAAFVNVAIEKFLVANFAY